MTTKRRQRIPQGTPKENPDENPADENIVESGNLFDPKEMKDDDYVRVQRRDDLEKTLVYHGRLAPGEASYDKLAELFGGGFYRCQWFQRDDSGAYYIKGTRTFKIPGEYKPPRELPGVGPMKQPPAASNGVKAEVGTFPEGMNASQALNSALVGSVIDLLKSMREVKAPAPQPAIDWGGVLTAAMPIFTALIERKSEPQLNSLELLKQIKELLPASTNPATPVTNTIGDMIKGIKELMGLKDIVEGKEAPADPESAMWGLAGKALDAITSRQQGNPAAPSAQPGAPAQPQLNMPRWRMMLLSQKKQLVNAASFGLDPGTAAETALTFLPPQMTGVLTEFLAMPDHVEVAMQTIPELREFVHWTTGFFAELKSQFEGEGEEVPDATEGSERKTGEEG